MEDRTTPKKQEAQQSIKKQRFFTQSNPDLSDHLVKNLQNISGISAMDWASIWTNIQYLDVQTW